MTDKTEQAHSDDADATAEQKAPAEPKAPRAALAAIAEFVAAHGPEVSVVPQRIGRIGIRLTLVGADGILGDVVVSTEDEVERILAAAPGLSVSEEWERELVSRVTPREGHHHKMAGWVARSKRGRQLI